jgi:AraC-like DNA-binding protein
VPLWEAEFDQKVRAFRHRLAPHFGHALLAQAYVFESLRLPATIWLAGDDWFAVHSEPSVLDYETGYDNDGLRGAYNKRCFCEVRRSRQPLLASFRGFSDLFVPLVKGAELVAVLVVGPFRRVRPSAADVLEQWQLLTGRQGHPSDPEFSGYLSASLATLVFDSPQLTSLERLLTNWAALATGEGDAETLANQIESDRVLLDSSRHVEWIWESVRTMLDERTEKTWQSRNRAPDLVYWNLSRRPDRVLVGLTGSAASANDPVGEIVRRDALQRSAVGYARRCGVLAGRVGDHGVVLLSITRGSEQSRVATLRELARRCAAWARRQFATSLHFGTSEGPAECSLGIRYQYALAAAQAALVEGKQLVVADSAANRDPMTLWALRRRLDRLLDESPKRVEADFDQYIEVVLSACGHRAEATRMHIELGFERLLESLVRQGALDSRSFESLRTGIERSVMSARNTSEVLDHYRRAVRELVAASKAPVPARRTRSIEHALAYIEQHYTEPLPIRQVARIAGFAPSYFSKLFIRSEHIPFSRYVTRLRLERAKNLLDTTDLGLARIAPLCGFPGAAYLCTAFAKATGTTPAKWRAARTRSRPGRLQNTTKKL